MELAGRGAQEEVSLAQLRGDEGREKDAQLKCAVTACEDMMVGSILLYNIHFFFNSLARSLATIYIQKKLYFP